MVYSYCTYITYNNSRSNKGGPPQSARHQPKNQIFYSREEQKGAIDSSVFIVLEIYIQFIDVHIILCLLPGKEREKNENCNLISNATEQLNMTSIMIKIITFAIKINQKTHTHERAEQTYTQSFGIISETFNINILSNVRYNINMHII